MNKYQKCCNACRKTWDYIQKHKDYLVFLPYPEDIRYVQAGFQYVGEEAIPQDILFSGDLTRIMCMLIEAKSE